MTLADALLAQIESVLPDGVVVYDLTAPAEPPDRYVVLTCGGGDWKATAVDGDSRDCMFDFKLMSVASWPDATTSAAPECRALVNCLRVNLIGWIPQVDGLVCGPITFLNGRDPIPDEAIADRHVVYAVDEFSVLADRLF